MASHFEPDILGQLGDRRHTLFIKVGCQNASVVMLAPRGHKRDQVIAA